MTGHSREIRVSLTAKQGFLAAQLGDPKGLGMTSTEVVNLSRSGMFVKTDRHIAPGLVIDFTIDPGLPNATRVTGTGTVRWHRARSDGPYAPQGLGLEVIEFKNQSESVWFELLERCLSDLKAVDLMNHSPYVVGPETLLRTLLSELATRHESVAVVVGPGRDVLGIVAESDLVKIALDPSWLAQPIPAVMQTHFRALHSQESAESVFEALRTPGLSHILVIDAGQFVGIISASSSIPALSELMDLKARRLKRSFDRTMNIVVHDLRSPISIIKTLNDLLAAGDIGIKQYMEQDMPGVVDDNCNLMLHLIDELMSAHSMDQKRVLDKAALDFGAITTKIFRQFQRGAAMKNIAFSLNVPSERITILGNSQRIEQILQNLISNAVKYSASHDRVTVSLQPTKDKAVLSIEDTGQGIPEHELPKVFDEYCQISSQPTSGEASTGLGLSITKRLVEAHEGTIAVGSTLGVGTTFTVTIPLHRATTKA